MGDRRVTGPFSLLLSCDVETRNVSELPRIPRIRENRSEKMSPVLSRREHRDARTHGKIHTAFGLILFVSSISQAHVPNPNFFLDSFTISS